MSLIGFYAQEAGPPLRPGQRGPERRSINLTEPEVYKRMQLSAADWHGNIELPKCCPSRLQAGSCVSPPCHIVRQGSCTKHGVVGSSFPVALSGVPKFHCRTHERSFNLLHPLVHENLPRSVVITPDVVVLTEDLVFLREAYEDFAVQVKACPF